MIDSITDQLVPEAYNHKNIKKKENNKFLKFYLPANFKFLKIIKKKHVLNCMNVCSKLNMHDNKRD